MAIEHTRDSLSSVIKAYDIRGVVGEHIDEDFVRTAGAAFAHILRGEGETRIAVGHDMRPSSPALAAAFAARLGVRMERHRKHDNNIALMVAVNDRTSMEDTRANAMAFANLTVDPTHVAKDLTDLRGALRTSLSTAKYQPDESFILHPGEFVLGSTYEQVTLPDDLAARLEGKSSLGRLGLLTHSTAGFIDPGFSGHVTLELSNVATLPITLWPGMKIGQLCFFRLSSPAETPYGAGGNKNRYQGQRGPTPSKAYLNFQ